MRATSILSPGAIAGLATCLLAACGGGDLTLPLPPSARDFEISAVGAADVSGRVGESPTDPLTVQVRDADGNPVAGWDIAFVLDGGPEAGTLEPDTARTSPDGLASSRWQFGTVPGTYTAEARVVAPGETDLPSVQFQAAVAPGPPDTLRAVSPINRPGRRGQELGDPVVVAVVDRYGNPVPGVVVSWAVQSGEGEVSSTLVPTDSAGQSSVRWQLGDRAGVQKLAATLEGVSGSPVVFNAVVLF